MEALLVVVFEILAAPLMAAAIAVAEFVLGIIVGVFEFIANLVEIFKRQRRRKHKTRQPLDSTSEHDSQSLKSPSKVKKIRRGFGLIVLIVLLATMVAALIVNTYYLEDSVRWTLEQAKKRSGISLDFDKVAGNLFTGKLELHGVRAKRTDSKISDFDFSIDSLRFDIAMLSAITRPIHIESLTINEISGTFERWAPRDKLKPRIGFVIDELSLGKADIMFIDATRDAEPIIVPVEISTFESRPFDSRRSIFSILFRANIVGKFSGQPFSVVTQGHQQSRKTQWHASNVAVTKLASLVGGPFKLFETGLVDVTMSDEWSYSKKEVDDAVIHLNWVFTFKDFHAEVPREYKGLKAKLAKMAVLRFNENTKESKIHFTTDIDEKQFDGSVTLNGAGIWKSIRQAMVATISAKFDASKDEVKSKLDSKLRDLKDKLQNFRAK